MLQELDEAWKAYGGPWYDIHNPDDRLRAIRDSFISGYTAALSRERERRVAAEAAAAEYQVTASAAVHERAELKRRAESAEADAQRLKALDDPEMDATDFAHPAWWRGHDHTSKVFCQEVTNILDGKDNGVGFNHEPWHTLRRRLLRLTREVELLRELERHLMVRENTNCTCHNKYKPRVCPSCDASNGMDEALDKLTALRAANAASEAEGAGEYTLLEPPLAKGEDGR